MIEVLTLHHLTIRWTEAADPVNFEWQRWPRRPGQLCRYVLESTVFRQHVVWLPESRQSIVPLHSNGTSMDSQKRQALPIALAVLLAGFVGATIILGIVAVSAQRRAQEQALRAEAKESEAQLAKSQAVQAQRMAEGLSFEAKLLAYVLGYQGLTQAELDTVVQKLETNARASKVLQDFREAGALYGEGLPPDAVRDYRTLLSNMAFNIKSRHHTLVQIEEQILGLIAAREEAEILALMLARVSAEASTTAQVRSRMAYELAQYAKNRKSSLSSLPGRLSPILETLAQDPDEEVQKTATAALAVFRANESPTNQDPRKPSPPVRQ